VNDPPSASADTYSVAAEHTLTVPAPGVLANDTDVDSTSLTAVKVTDPAHGTVQLNPNGGLTYTSNAGFAGTDSFTYQASDGALPSTAATVTISVSDAAPIAVPDSYSVPADTQLTVPPPGLLANDTDPDGQTTLQVHLTADVTHGTLTLAPNGSFVYTPTGGTTGPDTFTYQASDGSSLSAPATVTIVVGPIRCTPRPPIQASPVVNGGKLQVHVEATPLNTQQNNTLQELRFGQFENARVTLNGQVVVSGQTVSAPPNSHAVDFTVERATPGQPTTVPFTVVDGCGLWPTFVGGGAASGF